MVTLNEWMERWMDVYRLGHQKSPSPRFTYYREVSFLKQRLLHQKHLTKTLQSKKWNLWSQKVSKLQLTLALGVLLQGQGFMVILEA